LTTFHIRDSINNISDERVVIESKRFNIPCTHSLNGFPFDEIWLYPYFKIKINNVSYEGKFITQKRIPGRIISYSKENDFFILKRTFSEIWLVLITSIIFFILSVFVTIILSKNRKKLMSFEGTFTVAGYLIAMASFRDLLGISRHNGISFLEIVVILVPIIIFFIAILIGYLREIINK